MGGRHWPRKLIRLPNAGIDGPGLVPEKRSLMLCGSLRSMTNAYLQWLFRIHVLLACCFLWMVSAAAHAKMTIVTLSQLVKKSEIIVYGHFNPLASGASNQSPAVIQFEAESILKGKDAVAPGIIPLCNLEYPDEYDLAKLTGVDIVFISKKGPCYVLSHGDRSVVPVYDGRAHTVAIEDQPEVQLLQEFMGKIRTAVTPAAPTAYAIPAEDKRSQFVQVASDAAKTHDATAFGALYCDASKQKPTPAAAIFRVFSRAYSAPRLDRNLPEAFSLFICFESIESKEMCQVFSVGQIGERLCILDDRPGKHN